MNTNCQWLEERPSSEGHGIWQFMAHLRRMVCEFHQGPIAMREELGATPEIKIGADVVTALPAAGAFPTWKPDFECNPVADLEVFHIGSDRCHHP